MDETPEEWFVREILPHEASLMRYLRRVWPNVAELQDIRHDTYIRVLEAVTTMRPTAPKSFMFTIARNLMLDRLRRERIVSIEPRGDAESLDVLIDELSPEQRANAYQELRLLAGALDDLPPRCRAVMWLRKVEDLPQKEVAVRLGISEKAVGKQVARGIRLLAESVFGRPPKQADQQAAGYATGGTRHE